MPFFEPTLDALNRAEVRYVVVGGLVVVLHGHARLTADLDLAVDLDPDEARRAIDALVALGLRPTVPVEAVDFADPAIRSRWAKEKNMTVFSMSDPDDPLRQVDVFVENPVAFEDLWARSVTVQLASTHARIASIADLVRMKRMVGRPQDLADVEALEWIAAERGTDG